MDEVGAMEQAVFGGENRKWWTLVAVSLGLFMIMLDNTVVNVALPSIQHDLGLSLSELEWVVAGYALTFAAFMLTGGKLADLLGRRLMFVAGLAIFTAASLACGHAGGPEMLIGARVVQGVGAALMNPATLSIITATFPARQRGTAIGIWAGVSALALAIGPLVGGLLSEHVSWSWIFFVNVPVGVIAIVAAYLFIDESKDTSHGQRPDVPGLATSAIGLFALTYALIEANTYGWTSGRILALFAVAAVSLVAFVLLELHQRVPMLDLSLFKNGTFAGANSVMLLVGLAMFGVFFYNSLFIQNVMGYSAVQTGATFLPMTMLIILVAPAAGKYSDRVGSRWLMGVGMVLLSASLFIFSRLDAASGFWDLFPGLIIGGFGMALVMTSCRRRICARRGSGSDSMCAIAAARPSMAPSLHVGLPYQRGVPRRQRRTWPQRRDRCRAACGDHRRRSPDASARDGRARAVGHVSGHLHRRDARGDRLAARAS